MKEIAEVLFEVISEAPQSDKEALAGAMEEWAERFPHSFSALTLLPSTPRALRDLWEAMVEDTGARLG